MARRRLTQVTCEDANTLENALAKTDEELDTMAADLEEVHLGSEGVDRERVRTHAAVYLEAARTLVE